MKLDNTVRSYSCKNYQRNVCDSPGLISGKLPQNSEMAANNISGNSPKIDIKPGGQSPLIHKETKHKPKILRRTSTTSKSIESNSPSTSSVTRIFVIKANDPISGGTQKLIPIPVSAIKQEFKTLQSSTESVKAISNQPIIPSINSTSDKELGASNKHVTKPLIQIRPKEALFDAKEVKNLHQGPCLQDKIIVPTILQRTAPIGSNKNRICDSALLEQKRLIRKFCLVSPHKLVNESDPTNNPRVRYERIYNTTEEIPKLGRPHKTPVPKVLKHELNKAKNRIERIVMLPAREIRLAEGETQTEEADFEMSGYFQKYPRLIKISDKAKSEDQTMELVVTAPRKRSISEEEEKDEEESSQQPVRKRPSILRSEVQTISKSKDKNKNQVPVDKNDSKSTNTTDLLTEMQVDSEVLTNNEETTTAQEIVSDKTVTQLQQLDSILTQTNEKYSSITQIKIPDLNVLHENEKQDLNQIQNEVSETSKVQNNDTGSSNVQSIKSNVDQIKNSVLQVEPSTSNKENTKDLDSNKKQTEGNESNLFVQSETIQNKDLDLNNTKEKLTVVEPVCEKPAPTTSNQNIFEITIPAMPINIDDSSVIHYSPQKITLENKFDPNSILNRNNNTSIEPEEKTVNTNVLLFKDTPAATSKFYELLGEHRAMPEPHAQFLDFTAPEARPEEPPTELELLQAKLKLTDDVIEKARQDYENCMKRDFAGNLPLHRAVMSRDSSSIMRQSIVLKTCAKKIDIKNTFGLTPLHLALLYDCSKFVITKLVKLGSNPNIRDSKGNTVLHQAVLYSTSENLNALLPAGVSLVNELNDDGFSPLHIAVIDGKISHIHVLVSIPSIDINIPDAKSGRTALFHAVETGLHDVARLLVRRGGSKEATNFAGQSLMTLASESEKFREVVALLSKKRICQRKWDDAVRSNLNGSDNSRSND